MHRIFTTVAMFAGAFVLLTTTACDVATPLAPEPSARSNTGTVAAASDGSTLKANAPTLLSPTGDQTISGLRPVLEIASASGRFVPQTFLYEFEVQTASGSFVRAETVSGTTWEFPDNLQPNEPYRWRARAVLDGAVGPWSGQETFRTFFLPGCVDGVLADPRAYFFYVIGASEGSPAHDWHGTMLRSGIPAGLGPGQRASSVHYGFTQQIRSSGEPAGRLFLPTDTPDPLGYFTRPINFVTADGRHWIWVDVGGPAYAPRPCP